MYCCICVLLRIQHYYIFVLSSQSCQQAKPAPPIPDDTTIMEIISGSVQKCSSKPFHLIPEWNLAIPLWSRPHTDHSELGWFFWNTANANLMFILFIYLKHFTPPFSLKRTQGSLHPWKTIFKTENNKYTQWFA